MNFPVEVDMEDASPIGLAVITEARKPRPRAVAH
jgi:hypothetical protein